VSVAFDPYTLTDQPRPRNPQTVATDTKRKTHLSATLMGRIRQTVATDTERQTDHAYAGGREERESCRQFV
jgi:hypothetical protein